MGPARASRKQSACSAADSTVLGEVLENGVRVDTKQLAFHDAVNLRRG